MEQENVKERLNTLIHKKLSKNEKKLKEKEILNSTKEEPIEPPDNKEVLENGDGPAGKTVGEKCNAANDRILPSADYLCTHYLLHEILSEKKKALLQNREVIQFLKNKSNYDN